MPYVGCPVDVTTSVPCPSCVQAQLLISVLRQGMHPVCVDGSHHGPQTPPPQYDRTAPQLQVLVNTESFILNELMDE